MTGSNSETPHVVTTWSGAETSLERVQTVDRVLVQNGAGVRTREVPNEAARVARNLRAQRAEQRALARSCTGELSESGMLAADSGFACAGCWRWDRRVGRSRRGCRSRAANVAIHFDIPVEASVRSRPTSSRGESVVRKW